MTQQLKSKGKVRGAAIKNDLNYIRDKEGKKALKKLEQEVRDSANINFSKNKIKMMGWYPSEWHVALLKSAQKTLNWTEKDFFNLGYYAPKYSIMLRLFLKYFIKPENAFKQSDKYWKKHYSIGNMTYQEFDNKKRKAVISLKNFKIDPLLCHVIKGYLKFMVELLVGTDVQIKETKCPYKGGNSHEYVITW